MDTLQSAFNTLQIDYKHEEAITIFMNMLRLKSETTYQHSCRVALLATKIAQYSKLNPKPIFMAGCLHDIGKAFIPSAILHKTTKFEPSDMRVMKKHVLRSYELVRDMFPFSAEIILRHHTFQKDSYPKILPKCSIPFSHNTKIIIEYYARILSLADFYDALVSRVNDKFENSNKRQLITDNNKDQEYLIDQLYENNIFV